MWKYLFILSLFYLRFLSAIMRYLSKEKKVKKGILYLESLPIENAGYHYRSLSWKKVLQGHTNQEIAIWTIEENHEKYSAELNSKRYKFLTTAMWKRFKQVRNARNFKRVIVRRELLQYNDLGNLFLDRLLLHYQPNAILDFDDDLSAAKQEPYTIRGIKSLLLGVTGNKFNDSLKLYHYFIVASEFLKDRVFEQHANLLTNQVVIIPTCVEYTNYAIKEYKDNGSLTFGWIGNPKNLMYLNPCLESLNQLVKEGYNFEFNIICDRLPQNINDYNFPIHLLPWSIKDEVDLLKTIDIGLMPLIDNAIAKGKGGFKLIQYMGLGIVSVASPVTINSKIVNHKENSYLAASKQEWEQTFRSLLSMENRVKTLTEIGARARATIQNEYSFAANTPTYCAFVLNHS